MVAHGPHDLLQRALQKHWEFDRIYQLKAWNPQQRNQIAHDLRIMYDARDLQNLETEVIDRQQQIIAKFTTNLADQGQQRRDFALPQLDTARAAKGRFVINGLKRRGEYQHCLQLNWSDAAKLKMGSGTRFNHQNGSIFVDDHNRHTLIVVRSGAHGFAFAQDEKTGAEVFLHVTHAPAGTTQFRIGQRVSALLVAGETTSRNRGLQGRCIQPCG